jgi:[ribosomal protein S18]-alanine N-acetyltransferase
MIQLRGFQMRDLAGLHHLDQICFPRDIAYSKTELQYFLTHPRCSCWIAEDSGSKLAGFLIIERVSRNGRPAGHIITLDVDPAERRRGLGRLLMQTAEEQMKQEGAGVMSLEVAQNNAAARQFYRSLGFVTRGRIAKYYGGRVDAEVMEKTVGSAEQF